MMPMRDNSDPGWQEMGSLPYKNPPPDTILFEEGTRSHVKKARADSA
jgi:hypothetical protein